MRKIVPVHRKKDIISKNILKRRDIMRKKRKKKLSERKNGSFLEGSSLKGKTLKACFVCRRPGHFAKNCLKKEKAAKLLEKPRFMQMIFLCRMWSHSFPWMMITPLKPWQLWLIRPRKKTQNQTVNMIQT